MKIENASMEEYWDYFNPPKSEEEYQEVGFPAITLQKLTIYSKNKKNYTEIICVKHLTANKYYWC